MARSATHSAPNCLYCNQPARAGGKGEHVIPEAIGGARTLLEFSAKRRVCQRCSNGLLSQLDDELCSNSYLSLISSRNGYTKELKLWNVDHSG